MCKNNIWKIYATRKEIQVVLKRKSTKMLPRRGRRSGNGNKRR
jgi:hypothetical protein